MKKLTVSLALMAFTLSAGSLEKGERERAMSELHATRKRFLDAIAGLSEAQWRFKAAPDRWSVAEVAEHIALSEDMLMSLVRDKLLKAPAAAERTAAKDEDVLKSATDRSHKAQAPEMLRPTRRWPTRDALTAHFKESRDRAIEYVESTQDDLRAHLGPHPVFKTMDSYQWILFIAGHAERHVQQIEEVKADPSFPKM